MKLWFSCLAVVAVAASSHASFELVLAAGWDFGAGVSRIDRYDGDTGAYLGNFGAGTIDAPLGLALNKSTGIAYVYGGGGNIWAYNYNTGGYINSWNVGSHGYYGGISLANDGNLLIAQYDGLIRKLNSTTGATMTTYNLFAGAHPTAITQASDGSIFTRCGSIDGNSGGQIQHFAPGATSYDNATFLNASYAGVGGQLQMFGSNILAPSMSTHSLNVIPTTLSPGVNIGFSSNLWEFDGVALGHGQRIYVSGYQSVSSTTSSFIQKYDMVTGTYSPLFAINTNVGYTALATVVAPEPGVFVGLGTGVLALALRRKRK